MIVKNIKMYNFRCFHEKKIDFYDKINIITGPNAVGKTSVLESLYYLALTKSFKSSDNSVILKENEYEMAVIGSVYNESTDNENVYKIAKVDKNKRISKNDSVYSKISEYLGEFLAVAFTNNDLINLLGNARNRRNMFEPIICQISRFYVGECNNYKKLLNERNALLKSLTFQNNNNSNKVLEVIDLQMVECAKKIISYRKEFTKKVNQKIVEFQNKFSNDLEHLEIKYSPSCNEDEMEDKLRKSYYLDLKKGTTNVGPHRDDFVFIINNKNLVLYGSQGQQRSALISLKLAFVELLKEEKGAYPILILDDVLSELDKQRQNNLFEMINKNVQTFVSSSTLSELDDSIINKAKIIKL